MSSAGAGSSENPEFYAGAKVAYGGARGLVYVKRALPILAALLIALVAFSAAFAINTGIRKAVQLPDGVALDDLSGAESVSSLADASPPEERQFATPALGRQQYIDAVLKRNIFDSAAIGKTSAGPDMAAITTLNVRLVATMVASPDEFSSALIAEEGKDGSAKGYGLHAHIQDAEIIAIDPRKVTLRRADGNLEYLTMDDQAAPAPSTAPMAAAGSDTEGVSQIAENHYAVDRSVIEKYLSDIGSLSQMARAIPHKGPDGQIDGYRLSGIRRNSPLQSLGIKNGDVIHSVNGTSLGSMTDAMGAFQQLQSSSHFSFDVTRRGQQQQMEYDVR
jgi:type II secretion system protein C